MLYGQAILNAKASSCKLSESRIGPPMSSMDWDITLRIQGIRLNTTGQNFWKARIPTQMPLFSSKVPCRWSTLHGRLLWQLASTTKSFPSFVGQNAWEILPQTRRRVHANVVVNPNCREWESVGTLPPPQALISPNEHRCGSYGV